MKKINYLLMAFVALFITASFTACGDDEERIVEKVVEKVVKDTVTVKDTIIIDDNSNWSRFQMLVNQTVNENKKHDKVILVVAFGSTWQQAFDTFDKVATEYENEFGKQGYDVFLSFSSAICITQAAAGEHAAEGADVRLYFDPEHWLTAFGLAGYKEIVVQSLQVIPGEEFRRVRDSYVKDFMNNKNGDFTEEYMHSIDGKVAVGRPLMGADSDVTELADVLYAENDIQAALQNNGVVAFMGHGNPEGYDYFGANIRYTELEVVLQEKNPNLFVGTVDMEDNFIDDVLARMKEKGLSGNNVQLYPLMSIAGDHAHNDMADNEDEESWYSMLNAAGFKAQAYETNYPKAEACYTKYVAGEPYIPALAERTAVRKMWMQHTKDAIAAIAAGEGLSTPTTATED
jgi:sirohydrochlorin cobaltochelatase